MSVVFLSCEHFSSVGIFSVSVPLNTLHSARGLFFVCVFNVFFSLQFSAQLLHYWCVIPIACDSLEPNHLHAEFIIGISIFSAQLVQSSYKTHIFVPFFCLIFFNRTIYSSICFIYFFSRIFSLQIRNVGGMDHYLQQQEH